MEDEERFYLSLDENSRECMAALNHRCIKCYLKGFYHVKTNGIKDYWEDFNASYHNPNQGPHINILPIILYIIGFNMIESFELALYTPTIKRGHAFSRVFI